MSPASHDLFRARVCEVLRQLGAALDGLAMAAECSRLVTEPAADAIVTITHLEEAACAVDSAATLTHDLADLIDRQIDTENKTVRDVLAAKEAARE